MEIILVVSLVCIAVAAQPFAARRISPPVQGTLGSLCVGISLVLTALVASGIVSLGPGFSTEKSAQAAALPDVELPAEPAKEESSPSPSNPASVPNDESKFFEIPADHADGIQIDSDDTVIIPPGRPSWVEAPPQREGSVHSTSICSDPWATHQQANHALDEKLQAVTAEYIAEHLQSKLAASLIHYNLGEIKRKLLPTANVYHEKIIVSIGPMHQVHARLEFSPDFRAELDQRWAEMRATYRLGQTGLIGGGLLLLLATVFGYFRLDNATRGYYTGRLQFMAAGAILAIAASGVMFSRWIYWL